jgi:hypothetical protein
MLKLFFGCKLELERVVLDKAWKLSPQAKAHEIKGIFRKHSTGHFSKTFRNEGYCGKCLSKNTYSPYCSRIHTKKQAGAELELFGKNGSVLTLWEGDKYE